MKFNLIAMERMRIGSHTSKIIDKWRHLLEDDQEVTYLRQSMGFYCDDVDDLAFVLRWSNVHSSMHQHYLSMPLSVKCFTVGTHSRCFSKQLHSTGDFTGFFHMLKSLTPQEGEEGWEEGGKLLLLQVGHTWLGPIQVMVKGLSFLNYTTKSSRYSITNGIPNMTRVVDKLQSSLLGTYKF